MARVEFSDYIEALDDADALDGSELFVISQGGVAKKVTGSNVGVGGGGTEHWRGPHSTANAFPSSGGSGTAGAIQAGDMWYTTVDVTVGGNFYSADTLFVAKTNAPGQTLTNWLKLASQI